MSLNGKKLYEFGSYRLDPQKRQLWCGGDTIALTARFDFARYQFEHHTPTAQVDFPPFTDWKAVRSRLGTAHFGSGVCWREPSHPPRSCALGEDRFCIWVRGVATAFLERVPSNT